MASRRLKNISHACRIVVGAIFVFSGFVKSVDPWGTALKVNEYLSIYGFEELLPYSMIFSIWLCGAELMMGLMLVFKVRTRLISIFALVSMIFFTALTFLSATWIPVEDCGCFGDALKLTPWQTFLKNLVILPMVFVVWYRYRKYRVMELHRSEVALTCLFCIFAMGVGAYCYFNLPLIDFLPYKRGANIYEMIEAQHDTGSDVMAVEEYVLVYRNRRTGKLREFAIDDEEWQDEDKWEWVETRVDNEAPAVQTLISEFSISDPEGNFTRDILTRRGRVDMRDESERHRRGVPQPFAERGGARRGRGCRGGVPHSPAPAHGDLLPFRRQRRGAVLQYRRHGDEDHAAREKRACGARRRRNRGQIQLPQHKADGRSVTRGRDWYKN